MSQCKAYTRGRSTVSKEITPLINEMLRQFGREYNNIADISPGGAGEVYKTLKILQFNLALEVERPSVRR
jgi:hypothetical protein